MKPFVPSYDEAVSAITKADSTPVYFTNENHLHHKVDLLKSTFGNRVKIFYAMKANYNIGILNALKNAGIDGLDTVAPYEVLLGKKIGFKAKDILFTGNSCSTDEINFVHDQGVILNIGSISELRRFGENHKGASCALRLNVDIGAGECDFVVTGGEDTKFGISDKDHDEALKIINNHNLKIIGIHAHIGSGFYEKDSFIAGIQGVLERTLKFSNQLDFVNFGGGFGIRYNTHKDPINIGDWAKSALPIMNDFAATQSDDFHYRFEPGKFLVGESTCLLTKITMIKPERKTIFIGTDTGFNHLIRPALYQSYHEIINLTAIAQNRDTTNNLTVVGNVCESGDIFANNIPMPEPRESDILAIISAGAYGQSMSTIYQLRPPAAEIMMMKNGSISVTKTRKSFDELYAFIQ